MKRAIVLLAAACLACAKKPARQRRARGRARGVSHRERAVPPAAGAGMRISRQQGAIGPASEEKARESAWNVKPPEKLPDERGRIMCFFKAEFETGTTLGWENAKLVNSPGRTGQCLLLGPAPDGRSAVSARLQRKNVFANSSDFRMSLLCAADSPVEVAVQASSEDAPGRLFEKRLTVDAPDRWVRFDFPTSELRWGGDHLLEGGMVSELIVRAGRAGGGVRVVLDDVRIYTRLPELSPEAAAARRALTAPLPPGALFVSDFEWGHDDWSGRRVLRRGGGRALAGIESEKGAKSISTYKAFRFEVKPGLRLAFSCRLKGEGEGMAMIALFAEKGRHFFATLEGVKRGEWTDLDVPVDGSRFFTTTIDLNSFKRGGIVRGRLKKGCVVKALAFIVTGEKAKELVLDDIMLYVSKKPVPPPATPVPELASGPEWFDLFDGRSLDGWQRPYPVKWTVRERSMYASAPFQEGYLYARETFADFELQARLRPGRRTPGKPEVRLKFRWDFDKASGYEFRAGKKALLVKCGEGGDETLAAAELGHEVEKGRPCVVGVLARGELIECRVNGRKVASASVERTGEGALGLGVFHGEIFVEAVKLKEFD